MHCTEASTRFLYKVNIFSSPKKCSLSILSGGTDILRWRTRTASMSFWLLCDCQDWGQGGLFYNRLHIKHVNPSPVELEHLSPANHWWEWGRSWWEGRRTWREEEEGDCLKGEVRKKMSWKVDDWCFNGGYFCQRKHNSLFTSCLSSFAVLSSVTKLNTHTGENLFVWFRSTFTGHESKHSCLHEEKNHPFEMVPFLETDNVPHFLYWGCKKTAMR